MPKQVKNYYITERTVVFILLVLVLFLSPISRFWAALDAPWYGPYIIWGMAIAIAFFLQRYISGNHPK